MLNDYFFKDEIRNVTVALLDMFNALKVYRKDKNGNVAKIIDVPVKFGPAEKYFLFQMQRESGKKYYVTKPSIQVEFTNLEYDSERVTGPNELRQFYEDVIETSASEQFWSDVQPSPWNFNYTVQIQTESMSDMSQLLENILPGFNPSLHLRVKEFNFMNIERNMKVQINGGVSFDYPQEMSEEDSRFINATISLTVNAYLYRPVDREYIIKFIKMRYYYNNDRSHYEQYSTSGMNIDDTPPTDYTYGILLDGLNG